MEPVNPVVAYKKFDPVVALPPFFFLITFWGARFRDWFCKYTIPSLLSENNIPALHHLEYCRFLICTTGEDWAALQDDPAFTLLKQHIRIIFIPYEGRGGIEHKYHRMSHGHQMLADTCFGWGAIGININPDSIYPDGCVAEAQALCEAHKRVVLCAALRFDMDGVVAELEARGLIRPGAPLSLSRREAVDIGLRNLHPESRAAVWTAPNFGRLAPEHERVHLLTGCVWEMPQDQGAIVITHNWAPFLVDYSRLPKHNTASLDGRAIDGDYIYDNFGADGTADDIHVVTDSDRIFLLGLTPHEEMVPPRDRRLWKQLPVIGEWSRGYILNQTVFDKAMDPLKRRLYTTRVRWHRHDLTAAWDVAEMRVRRYVEQYATRNLNPRPGAENGAVAASWNPRALWYRAMHESMFERKPSPFARLRDRSSVYLNAVRQSLSGDPAARQAIKHRLGQLLPSRLLRLLHLPRPRPRRAMIVAGATLALLVLANVVAYYLIDMVKPGPPRDFVSELQWPGSDVGRRVLPEAFGTDNWEKAIGYYNASPGTVMHPVLPYATESADNEHFHIGLEGIRYEPGWTDDDVRAFLYGRRDTIYLFGGSTVLGHGVGAEHTISYFMNRRTGKEGPVALNFGSQAYDQQRELEKLVYLLRAGLRPKAVAFLDGWADIFTMARSNLRLPDKIVYHGFIQNRGEVAFTPGTREDHRSQGEMLLEALPLYRLLRDFRRSRIDIGDILPVRDPYRQGFDFYEAALVDANWAEFAARHRGLLKRQIIAYYEGNLAVLKALAAGFGFDAYLFYQPLGLLDPDNPFVTERARRAKGYDYVVEMDQRIREAIAAGELAMIDLSQLLLGKPGPNYIDVAHYSPQANRLLAERIREVIGAR